MEKKNDEYEKLLKINQTLEEQKNGELDKLLSDNEEYMDKINSM